MSRIVPATLILVAACSSDGGTGPSPSYENIAGTYTGALAGLAQGVALDATFSLTITQNGGSLGGAYAIDGTLNDGVQIANVQGTGTLTGTIAAGNNPSVNFTLKTGSCPNYSANFSGSYDSANSRLTVSGPVDFWDNTCTVLLTYQSVIILGR